MKRGALIVTGVVLLLVGLAAVTGGALTAALFGSDGAVSAAPARITGQGVALVVDDITVDASSIPVPEGVGTLTLSVSSADGSSMFVGTATDDDVDTYLTAAPYDVVVSLTDGGQGQTRQVPGTQQPPVPTDQGIWSRQSLGDPAQLTAKLQPATTLVIMNADASPGVDATVVVTFTVARAWTAAWVAVGVGVLLLVLSGIAFWRAAVRRRRALAEAGARHSTGAVTGSTVLPGESVSGPITDVLPAVETDPVADQSSASATTAAMAATVASAAAVVAAAPSAGLADLVAEATAAQTQEADAADTQLLAPVPPVPDASGSPIVPPAPPVPGAAVTDPVPDVATAADATPATDLSPDDTEEPTVADAEAGNAVVVPEPASPGPAADGG